MEVDRVCPGNSGYQMSVDCCHGKMPTQSRRLYTELLRKDTQQAYVVTIYMSSHRKGDLYYWQNENSNMTDWTKTLTVTFCVSMLVYNQRQGQKGTQDTQDSHRSAGARSPLISALFCQIVLMYLVDFWWPISTYITHENFQDKWGTSSNH